MDVVEVGKWVALVVAVVTASAGLFRAWAKVQNSVSADTTATAVNNQLLTNLRDEITRLNGVIQAMGQQIDDLEDSINALKDLEMYAASDFGALEMVVGHMPCATCCNQGEAFVQLQDVIDRMKLRRKERRKLMSLED